MNNTVLRKINFEEPAIVGKIAMFNAPNNPEKIDKYIKDFHDDNKKHREHRQVMNSIIRLKKGGLSRKSKSKSRKSKSRKSK